MELWTDGDADGRVLSRVQSVRPVGGNGVILD
jgi:hypothetical protein